MDNTTKIFITYAHKDKAAKNKLVSRLNVLKREGLIDIRDDNEITPDDRWRDAKFTNLADSNLLLHLVSTSSLVAKSRNRELAKALDAKIKIIPIILESCDWLYQPLSNYQVLPEHGKPINQWVPVSKGWQNVADGIRHVAEEMRDQISDSDRKGILFEWLFQQGNFLMTLRQIERAIEAYSHVIELKPDYADAYNSRGVAHGTMGEFDCAIEDLNRAIELKRDSFDAYRNRGNVHYFKGNLDRAAEDYNIAIELKPDYADAYNSRGVVYQIKGNDERAIEDHNRAIQLKSDYAQAYNNRGIAYESKGKIDQAIEDYNEAIGLEPNYAVAYVNRGNAYHGTGDLDRAIKDYNKAIKVSPHLADAYYNRGNYYNDKDDFDRAIEDYNKAIELKPDYAKAYNNRGMAYYGKEDYDCAIKDFTKATEIKPDHADAYYNRGNAHIHRGEADPAIIDYNKVIELKPDYANAYSNRGVAYYSTKDYERAIEDFIKAIELKPDDPEVYFNRGVALGDRGYHERAILDYSKTIELKPHHVIAYYNRGVAYGKISEYVDAIQDYSTAIEINSNFGEAYNNRGEAWLHLREWEKAKEDLITAKKEGVDIVAAFRNDYRNVAAFERANQVKLPEDIAVLVRQGFRNRYPRKEKVLTADGQSSESPEVLDLRHKLQSTGLPLEKYIKTQPYFGIKTAPSEVFVVDRNTRDKLIAEHPSSYDILKPLLQGRDIRRWHVEPPEQWLIFAYRGIEINAYPAIRRYLEKHRDTLSTRKRKGGWYELQASIDEIERYARPKLVCPNLYNTQTFAVETEGYFCGSTCYIIPTEETWLCGLLNSRAVEWFYSQHSDQLGPGELQARGTYIKQIPVPDLNAEQKNLVRKIVEYLIYLQNQPTTSGKDLAHARDFLMLKYFERIINGLVYEFYMPDVLQDGNRDLFKHLMAEQLSEVKEIHRDKMLAFRTLYDRLYHKEHPVRINLFFQDSLRPIRIIEDKW